MASPYTVQMEWHPPRGEDRNGIIQAYIVNVTELNTGTTWQQRVENDTDAILESLHPFYSYGISVAAQTVALGPFTSKSVVEMPEDGKIYSSLNICCVFKDMNHCLVYSSIKSTNVSVY